MSHVQTFAPLTASELADVEKLIDKISVGGYGQWIVSSRLAVADIFRLLATAKQGVEAIEELSRESFTIGAGREAIRQRLATDAALAHPANAGRPPATIVTDEEVARAARELNERGMYWPTAKLAAREILSGFVLRGGNQSGVLPAAPPESSAAAAVERGVRETTDTERLDWILSNLWDDTIEIEGAPGSRRCLSFTAIDPDNLTTRRDQIDYVREVVDAARKGVPARSGTPAFRWRRECVSRPS